MTIKQKAAAPDDLASQSGMSAKDEQQVCVMVMLRPTTLEILKTLGPDLQATVSTLITDGIRRTLREEADVRSLSAPRQHDDMND